MEAQELELQTRLGAFAGLNWEQPGAANILCLHGWLDNAASFLPLAPHLDRFNLVAVDFAGHGNSCHRAPGARYHMLDNLWDIDAILDALEWDNCILLGHSLGGAVGCTYAAADPARVTNLITLDGLGPLSSAPGDAIRRLRNALGSIRKASGKLRNYASTDEAAKAIERATGLPFAAAHLLCKRALEQHNGGFRWKTDSRLNWHSPALLYEAQVLEYLAAIEAPVLAITATPLMKWVKPETAQTRLDAIPDCRHFEIEGHHHFHMDQPARTAELILDFLS